MSKYIACTICNRAEEYSKKLYKKVYGDIPYKCSICCKGTMDPERAWFHVTQIPVENHIQDKEKAYRLFWAYHYVYHLGELEMDAKEWHLRVLRCKEEIMDYLYECYCEIYHPFFFNLIEARETERICTEWLQYEPNEYDGEADLDPVPVNNWGD